MTTYLFILRRNQADEMGMPEAEVLSRFMAWTLSLHSKGILRHAERLKSASQGATIRSGGGLVAVEGPYAEQEAVIGIFLIDADDHTAAQAIAKECPILLVRGSVEIRETEFFPKP